MENKIIIEEKNLIILPQGINKLASMKSSLTFPLQHVLGASIDSGILNESKGLRAPGTSIPGYWAGSFSKNGEKTFFNVKRSSKPIVIQLKNEAYDRLVLGSDQPEEIVDLINNRI